MRCTALWQPGRPGQNINTACPLKLWYRQSPRQLPVRVRVRFLAAVFALLGLLVCSTTDNLSNNKIALGIRRADSWPGISRHTRTHTHSHGGCTGICANKTAINQNNWRSDRLDWPQRLRPHSCDFSRSSLIADSSVSVLCDEYKLSWGRKWFWLLFASIGKAFPHPLPYSCRC